jgi:hypothetical protein
MSIGNVFIFTLQECIQNVLLIVPKLEEGAVSTGAISLPAKIFDCNFLLFVSRFGRVCWQVRMASAWRG